MQKINDTPYIFLKCIYMMTKSIIVHKKNEKKLDQNIDWLFYF